ncbi:metallophosphoesterase [Arhodomonas sp. KWT2]|uniref:metallophosphoesterase n=1 Tax=Arhodomonas sp. KWT2 TaxID=3344194 RepID=UPI0035BEDB12
MSDNTSEPPGGVKPLRVLQVSDTHLYADPAADLAGVPTSGSARAVLDAALAGEAPDLIVATGDLVHDGSAAGYERLRGWLADSGVPALVIPGNHDDPVAMARCFAEAPVTWRESVSIGGWQVIALDSHVPGEPWGRLGAAQLERLDGHLAAAATPVLVAVHHPPVAVGARWLDGIALADGEALLARLGACGRPAVVIWGHIHQAFEGWYGGVRLLGAPSTCIQFAPLSGEFALDIRPPGWRELTLHPGGGNETCVGRLSDGAFRPVTDCEGY